MKREYRTYVYSGGPIPRSTLRNWRKREERRNLRQKSLLKRKNEASGDSSWELIENFKRLRPDPANHQDADVFSNSSSTSTEASPPLHSRKKEVENLKKRLMEKEREIIRLKEENRAHSSLGEKVLMKMEDMQEESRQGMASLRNELLAVISTTKEQSNLRPKRDLLQESTSASTFGITSDEPPSYKEEMVNLGDNVKCKITCWMAMERSKCENDWASALLRGVYGDEARHYRMQPRQSGCRKFGKDFLDVAKGRYESFLKKLGFSGEALEQAVAKLPKTLSCRARDMNGRRNKKTSESSSTLNRPTQAEESNGLTHWDGSAEEAGSECNEDDDEAEEEMETWEQGY